MKIAVLSDVHGNVPALDAVLADIDAWRPDEIIVNGDLVNRGPCSLAALRMLRERAPAGRVLAGNHERFVLASADAPADPSDPTYELDLMAAWSARQLGAALAGLRAVPAHIDLTGMEGGSSLHITHGSRLGDRDGIHPETDGDELARKLGDPRALFVSSHTHRAFIRPFNGRLLANTGSVGQPMDRDRRASYARLTFRAGAWSAEIVRVAYHHERAERDFHDSGFLDECGPITQLILRELREARAHVAPWRRRFLTAVKQREIGVGAAVEQYLAQL
jgi:predicted phosphodiesterase